jgi:16S rRNA (cytosine967-C5)-methyltransferase
MTRAPRSYSRRPPRQQRSPQPERPVPTGWESRLAAADLILRTIDGGTDIDTAMTASTVYSSLEGPDRGFARAIAGAALRGLGRIDWALGSMIDRPLDALEPPVRALLRAGAAQLWMLNVAGHAAVSSTVEAARRWPEATKAGGLINAVLRRAEREGEAFANAPAVSVWPDWLSAKMKSALGTDRAETLARLQLDEPPLDLTLKPGEDAALWAEKLEGQLLPNGSVRLKSGVRLTDLPGYAEGAWWVQDAGASLAVRLMGDVTGQAVADLCAAPGGKSLQLAAAGARLTALDISRQRLTQLHENAERTGLAMEIVEADARTWRPDAPLDAVLLDAPCSALGILRRHPEGVWRRDPKGMSRYAQTQAALVAAAGEMLRPGGRLVYCVCTPTPEEGREVIEAALAGGGWRRVPVGPGEAAGFAPFIDGSGDLLTAPLAESDAGETGLEADINVAATVKSDVFYIARLERTG